MRIAIAGATGVVGRHAAAAVTSQGHEVVPLARALGTDLLTGAGLAERLDGVDAVIDTLNTRHQRRRDAEEFFGKTSRHLLAAEGAAGVRHHVVLSIIGIDRIPLGYYHGKRVQEDTVVSGSIPWTILRAAQFHEFAEQALGFARWGPVSLVPRMLSQPVAAREVGVGLATLAAAPAQGRVSELAGPEPHQMLDLARQVNAARGLGRRVVPVSLPGAAGKAMRSGGLLPQGEYTQGTQTFADWLAAG